MRGVDNASTASLLDGVWVTPEGAPNGAGASDSSTLLLNVDDDGCPDEDGVKDDGLVEVEGFV